MMSHEQFASDLTRYALGELSPTERSEVDRHLGSCGDCRSELERLQGDTAMLALTSPPVAPPPRARARLVAAVAREPRLEVVAHGARHRSWWMWVPSFTALALAIAVGVLWHDNSDLRQEATEMTGMMTQYELDAQKTKEVMSAMTAKGAVRANLVETGSEPQAHGKATYNPGNGDVVLVASDLKQLPPGQTYQLWLVPTAGGKPIPAGNFKPDVHGHAVFVQRAAPKVKTGHFAVTIEAKGAVEPSSPVILASAGE
jgi:anti-sigma factor RsiW